METSQLLLDAFGRIRGTVEATLEGLDGASLTARPSGGGNSIAWLIWHLARVEDAQVADAEALEQVWTGQGFAQRFGLPLPERDVAALLLAAYCVTAREREVCLEVLRQRDGGHRPAPVHLRAHGARPPEVAVREGGRGQPWGTGSQARGVTVDGGARLQSMASTPCRLSSARWFRMCCKASGECGSQSLTSSRTLRGARVR